MSTVLVDSSVLLDVLSDDPVFYEWSAAMIESLAEEARLVINPLIYAEVSSRFNRIEELDEALPEFLYRREPLPFEAAFLAGKAFLKYRRRGGSRSAPIADFYI